MRMLDRILLEPEPEAETWPRSRFGWIALGVFIAVVALYLVLRMAGVLTLVGYHEGEDRWLGETGIQFDASRWGWPVRLGPGEALLAHYDVRARTGNARLIVRPTLGALQGAPRAIAVFEGDRTAASCSSQVKTAPSRSRARAIASTWLMRAAPWAATRAPDRTCNGASPGTCCRRKRRNKLEPPERPP